MKLAAIAPGDIVLVSKGGRQFHARVESVSDGVVKIVPIGRGLTYRQATAHEVIDHWRHVRARRPDEEHQPAPGQLSLAGPLDQAR